MKISQRFAEIFGYAQIPAWSFDTWAAHIHPDEALPRRAS